MALTCPYCRAAFAVGEDPEDQPVACSACGMLHHAECLAENGGCTVFGCSQAPADEVKVNVSAQDVTRPQPLIPSPPSSPAPARVPPPPRVAGAAAPIRLSISADDIAVAPGTPIAPGNLPALSSSLSFMGYAPVPQSYSSYTIRKNRVAYVVLAVFFGSFGIHNFYAGYIKKAVVQCCLSVFTFLVAAPFIWVWAIVEACRVSQDSDGVAFT